MDITPVLKSAGELGVLGAVVIILVLVLRDMSTKLTSVVQNNTEALTRLCDNTAATKTALGEHDERAQRIEAGVQQIGRVTDRIEQKVDQLKVKP